MNSESEKNMNEILSHLEIEQKKIFDININNKKEGFGFSYIIPFPNEYNLIPVMITCAHLIGIKIYEKNFSLTYSKDKNNQTNKI